MLNVKENEGSMDRVFLPTKEIIQSLKNPAKHPIPKAVTDSNYTNRDLSPESTWSYWLLIKNPKDQSQAGVVNKDGGLGFDYVIYGHIGVVPCIKLKNSVTIATGQGTIESPYILAQ